MKKIEEIVKLPKIGKFVKIEIESMPRPMSPITVLSYGEMRTHKFLPNKTLFDNTRFEKHVNEMYMQFRYRNGVERYFDTVENRK